MELAVELLRWAHRWLGLLLTDEEGKGLITGRRFRQSTPPHPFVWEGLPSFFAFAWKIWVRRSFVRKRKKGGYEPLDLDVMDYHFAASAEDLLVGGPSVVLERERLVLLVGYLSMCATILRSRASAETMEWIILWVKSCVADFNPRYRETPVSQLREIPIEDLLADADLVEFHVDHEGMVLFLMEHLKLPRNSTDVRLKRLREQLIALFEAGLLDDDLLDEDDEDTNTALVKPKK